MRRCLTLLNLDCPEGARFPRRFTASRSRHSAPAYRPSSNRKSDRSLRWNAPGRRPASSHILRLLSCLVFAFCDPASKMPDHASAGTSVKGSCLLYCWRQQLYVGGTRDAQAEQSCGTVGRIYCFCAPGGKGETMAAILSGESRGADIMVAEKEDRGYYYTSINLMLKALAMGERSAVARMM